MKSELKSRIIYGLIFGGITGLCLLNTYLFFALLVFLFYEGFKEINGVVSNNIKATFLSLYLLPALISAFFLRIVFPFGLLFVILATVINDTAAYFIGKKFGSIKLMPSISPKKTLEGFIAGVVATIIFSLSVGLTINILDAVNHLDLSFILLITLGLIIAIVGTAGDLIESGFKRKYGIKDMDKSLGAHGGFLDRLDSHILAIPCFFLFFVIFILPNF